MRESLTSMTVLPLVSRFISIIELHLLYTPKYMYSRDIWKDFIAYLHEVAEISYCNMIGYLPLDAYIEIIFIRIM